MKIFNFKAFFIITFLLESTKVVKFAHEKFFDFLSILYFLKDIARPRLRNAGFLVGVIWVVNIIIIITATLRGLPNEEDSNSSNRLEKSKWSKWKLWLLLISFLTRFVKTLKIRQWKFLGFRRCLIFEVVPYDRNYVRLRYSN